MAPTAVKDLRMPCWISLPRLLSTRPSIGAWEMQAGREGGLSMNRGSMEEAEAQ